MNLDLKAPGGLCGILSGRGETDVVTIMTGVLVIGLTFPRRAVLLPVDSVSTSVMCELTLWGLAIFTHGLNENIKAVLFKYANDKKLGMITNRLDECHQGHQPCH